MAVVVYEKGAFALMAKYIFQKRDGGVFYFRRRVPDDVRGRLSSRQPKLLMYSLKTRDKQKAAELANRDALRQDALWKAIRNGAAGSHAEVILAATEFLRGFGLQPGLGAQEPNHPGLDHFWEQIHQIAVSCGAPEEAVEQEDSPKKWWEYLPLVEREAADQLFKSSRAFEKSTMLLSRAFAEFQKLKAEEPDSASSKVRRLAVDAFISVAGDLPIEHYTREDANNLVRSLLAKGNKSTTVKRRVNSLRPIFEVVCREYQLHDQEIFKALIIPRMGEDSIERPSFTKDELHRVQVYCLKKNDTLSQMLAILSDTGMRLAEVVGLQTEDISLSGSTPHIIVRPNKARTLKTRGSERVVPLVGVALWAAKSLLAEASGPYLFPKYSRDGECKATSVSNVLNKRIRAMEIDKTCHSLRHTFRDRLRDVGASSEVADRIGGWSTKGVGQSYGHGHSLNVLYDWMVKIEDKEILKSIKNNRLDESKGEPV